MSNLTRRLFFWIALLTLFYAPPHWAAETEDCTASGCTYRVPLDRTGFYIAVVTLPPGQPEGVWSLLINPKQAGPLYSGSFFAGATLKENASFGSWVGFSLADTETVQIKPTDYTGANLPFTVELRLENNLPVYGPIQMTPGQAYTTSVLSPGFYVTSVSSQANAPDTFFGVDLTAPSIYGGVVGGWLDSKTGPGYAAFSVNYPQTVTFELLFDGIYRSAGSGRPYLKIYYQNQDGSRALYWPSSELAEDADLTKDIKDLEYLPGPEKLYILQDGLQVNILVNEKLVRHVSLRDMSKPQGIALDNQENLYVADTGNHRIVKLSAAGDYQPDPLILPDGAFGKQGSEKGQFQSPEDVAIGKVKGEWVIYVADTGNNRIQRFNRAGIFQIAFDGSDSPEGALKAPRSLLVSDGGGIAVVDSGNGRIRVFNSEGKSLRSFGSLGNAAGQLNNPLKISQSFIGSKLIVADTGNNRVQLFNASGEFEREITGLKTSPAIAIFRDTRLGEQLEIAPITGGVPAIEKVSLSEDPPGTTPVDVVRSFLTALASQDLQTAGAFVEETINQENILTPLQQDAVLLTQVAKVSGSVENLTLKRIEQNTAWVIGKIKGTTEATTEFVLRRVPTSNAWKIIQF